MNHNIGDLVYVRVNEGRGVSLVELISRHDEESWDVNLSPRTIPQALGVIHEDDILDYDPYTEEME